MPADLSIADLLTDLGFIGPAALAEARACLERHGLTNPRKSRIDGSKRDAVEDLLERECARACADPRCQSTMRLRRPRARLVMVAQAAGCECCGGSANSGAIGRFAATCRAHGVRSPVVVGGSPTTRAELAALGNDGVELRMIDGIAGTDRKRAVQAVRGADLLIIWGSTQLDHKVSALYKDVARVYEVRQVTVAKRGVAALLAEVTAGIERRAEKG